MIQTHTLQKEVNECTEDELSLYRIDINMVELEFGALFKCTKIKSHVIVENVSNTVKYYSRSHGG